MTLQWGAFRSYGNLKKLGQVFYWKKLQKLVSRGARRRLATAEAYIVPPDEVLCVGKGFLIMKL
jgi:hypothetical protein